MNVTEDDLARAAAGGDAAAFGALIEQVYDRIHGLAWRLTGHVAEAEDLTQDICLALPVKLTSFDGRARFTTWLYRVVVNAAHDRRRRQASQQRACDGWGDWEQHRQAEIAEDAQNASWLTAALQDLPDDLRDTAVLILDDLTQANVAEVLGIAQGTVAWRMSEVKKRLRAAKEAEA